MNKERETEKMTPSETEERRKKVAFGIGVFLFLVVLYFITAFVLAYRL